MLPLKKVLLATVIALEKCRSYPIGIKVVIYIDHATIEYMLNNSDLKTKLIRWMLLLQ